MGYNVRVLQIISGYAIEGPLGGIERFGVELAKALPPPIEPVVCGLWDYGTESDRTWLAHLQTQGIEAFTAAPRQGHSPYKSFRAAYAGARMTLRGQTFDVIHSHCQFGDPLAIMLRRELGADQLIRTVHNEKEWPRRPERRLLFSNLIALLAFRHEIGVSQQVVETLNHRPLARLLRRRARLIFNALNLSRFEQQFRADALTDYRHALGLPEGAIVIGSVGRLETQKGYSDLIAAMPAIVAAHPHVYLVIAGEGSLRGELETQIVASPIAAHIRLAGPQSEIERFYALLTLFVSPSWWEGLPTVLLESMAAGVPIVATDVSGSRELVTDGVTGRLVPPRSPATLAQGISAALHDEAMRQAWARAARTVVAQFDIRTVAGEYAILYADR